MVGFLTFAYTAVLLLSAARGMPSLLEQDPTLLEQNPTLTPEYIDLNSINDQGIGVFDGDGFSYNGKHNKLPEVPGTHTQEDMVFEDDSEGNREKRNAVSNLWPGGIIPYEITSSFDDCERRIILQAMRHWEENTCIRFRPRTSADRYYVTVVTSVAGDCRSYVGRIFRQPQQIWLGNNCVRFSTVVHELGHAIGFFHEHNRSDRDEYIDIFTQNIFSGVSSAFTIDNGNTLGLGYDYASVMHYSNRAFSRDGVSQTLQAKDPSIQLGGEELSPLDIAKANRLYSCSCPLRPPTTVVPPPCQVSRPAGVSCGSAVTLAAGARRTVQAPGYPNHFPNQRCAWVFSCPAGFTPQITFPNLNLESSPSCNKDFAQVFFGATLDSNSAIRYGGTVDGRICGNLFSRYRLGSSTQTITILYQTDGTVASAGFQTSVTCIDTDECRSTASQRCSRCTNTPGSFECECGPGYYFSRAAATCHDINECAYNNGGCQGRCINRGGSYECQCPSGQFVQSDGKRCGPSRPSFTSVAVAEQLPGFCSTVPPPPPTQPPTLPPTTQPPTQPPTLPPTTQPPTRPPTLPPTTRPPTCGGLLTASSGSLQTPNWPQTYPFNFQCEWTIQPVSSGCSIQMTFDNRAFGIAGSLAADGCTRDYLRIFNSNGVQIGNICGLDLPSSMTTIGTTRLLFNAGPSHGPLRTGVRVNYRTVCPTAPPPTTIATTTPRPTTQPTTLPPTTAPLPDNVLVTQTGSIQSPNWPVTYPVNIDREWFIRCPPQFSRIVISVSRENFWIGGRQDQLCAGKDWLRVYTGESVSGAQFGPYCQNVPPAPFVVQSNRALVLFHAGERHQPTRTGFSLIYLCF